MIVCVRADGICARCLLSVHVQYSILFFAKEKHNQKHFIRIIAIYTQRLFIIKNLRNLQSRSASMKKKEMCFCGAWGSGLEWTWQCWVDGWTQWPWSFFPALMNLWLYCCSLLLVPQRLVSVFSPFSDCSIQSPLACPAFPSTLQGCIPQTGEVLGWAPLSILLLVWMQWCQQRLWELQLTAHQLLWCCAPTKRGCTTASPTHSDAITVLWCYNCAKQIFPLLQSPFRKHIICGDGNACVEDFTLLPTFHLPENKDCPELIISPYP